MSKIRMPKIQQATLLLDIYKPSKKSNKNLHSNLNIMKVESLPKQFDAVQFKVSMNPLQKVFFLFGMPYPVYMDGSSHFPFIWITTMEGMVKVYQEDYIMRDFKGQLSVCKSFVFEESYQVLTP